MSSTTGIRIVEQPGTPVWRQGQGWVSEYKIEGLYDDVDATAQGYAGQSGVVEIRYTQLGGDLWQATVVFAAKTKEDAQTPATPDSLVEVTWAFPRNDIQREVWVHPRLEAQLQKMNLTYRGRFRADVEAWLQGQLSLTMKGVDGTENDMELGYEQLVKVAVGFGAEESEIRLFLSDLADGAQTYNYSRRVLRNVRTGPTAGEWWKANANTNRLYSRGKLIAEINPPAWVAYKMPEGYWFKHEPDEEQVGTKLQMNQEYEYFGLRYSRFSYGEPIE